ncbi:MAG TPA: DUF1549 domain-containing protein, partial [Gemmataceae bacterium]|nr:DUF1549 domain-containing protein [Gemmataceae bacterium]
MRWSPFALLLAAPAFAGPDFNRDVQPIFARACLSCHGPDKQKGGLRLDRPAAANVLKAELITRVTSTDAETRMPPKGDPLTAEQVKVLREWVAEGARWPTDPADVWWSLKPIARPAVRAADPKLVRNAIDAFVLAKLREKGLRPSPEADRRTLLRRLSFDLLGLPPSPDEVDAFVTDPDPRAYEKLVDRLLDSPHFGERWARHWLDVVHYGDSHGYDKDKPRPNAYPYRDYVIRSFNADKPYGRFVQEQVAGDVLFPGTRDGIEALGFIAAGPWDFIGHAELPESKIDGKIARHLDRDDMVSNTMGTFMSLTVHCAQCHNHKFDPIATEDYYRLQAVFAAVDRTDKGFDLDPGVAKTRLALTERRKTLEARLKEVGDALAKAGGKELTDLDARLAAAQDAPGKARPEFGYHSALEADPLRTKWVQVDLGAVTALDAVTLIGCHDDFNNIGAGFGFPVRFKIEACDDPTFARDVRLIADHTGTDYTNPGTSPRDFKAKGVAARYVRVTATKLAPRQNDFMFALSELEVRDAAGKNVAAGATVTALDSIEAPVRWRKSNLTDGLVHLSARGADIARLRTQRQALVDRLTTPEARAEGRLLREALAGVQRDLSRLPPQKVAYVGAVHTGSGTFTGTGPNGGKPRPIAVLPRGDVTKPGKVVGPGPIRGLPGLPSEFDLPPEHPEAARRAALAKWLSAPDNPLTWRSAANRVWLYHFGRGIVDTPNDFGRMGQLPTHPELLDWLAAELRDTQSLKHLHRLIVTSATYRQASADDPALAKADSSNAYYWRGTRRKLEAEAVRDSLLAVAGKLDRTPFGPGFQDFVIDKPDHSPHYEYHLHDPEDPRAHRRSVYRFIVRSQLQPFLATLDCADPSLPVDKRTQTISPLQALALLNNKLCVAMSKHFAARVEKVAPDTPGRLTEAYRLALGRKPTADELTA